MEGKATERLMRSLGLGVAGALAGMALWGPVAEAFGANAGTARAGLVVVAVLFLAGIVLVANRIKG